MDSSMQTFAAFLTAFGAFVGALVLAYRGLSGDRFSRRITESAALLTGYTEMVKNLRVEISEIRVDHANEVARNKAQCQEDSLRVGTLHKLELEGLMNIYSAERKQWEDERLRLEKQVEILNEKIDDLSTQVYVLRNQPPPEPKEVGEVNV